MNILIATYNYLPYALGGSEIYVSGLARELKSKNHSVRIMASVPESAKGTVIFDGKRLKIITYIHDDIEIFGIQLTDETTDEIYGKYSTDLCDEWRRFFQTCSWASEINILHFNGYTGAVNLAIADGLQTVNAHVRLYFSYHTPVSCPKGTLLYFDNQECTVKPNLITCTGCMIHRYSGFSKVNSKIAGILLPVLKSKALPNKVRIKHLVQMELNSFRLLVERIDRWFTFSDGIYENLIRGGVASDRITKIRHGISDRYFNQPEHVKKTDAERFVFIGRLVKIKGILTLLKAWSLTEEKPNRKLIIIGDTTVDSEEIREAIMAVSDRKDIEFTGKKNQTEIRKILTDSHCLIAPSESFEIGPLVIHEAVVCNCNVIASDIGGSRELASLYKDGCWTFPAGNHKALKDMIENFVFRSTHYKPMSEAEHFDILLENYNGK